jgi:hypothetical protein
MARARPVTERVRHPFLTKPKCEPDDIPAIPPIQTKGTAKREGVRTSWGVGDECVKSVLGNFRVADCS